MIIYIVVKVLLRYNVFSTYPYLIITVVIILLIELEYNSKCYEEPKRMVFSCSVLISIVFIPSLQQWLLFLPALNLILSIYLYEYRHFIFIFGWWFKFMQSIYKIRQILALKISQKITIPLYIIQHISWINVWTSIWFTQYMISSANQAWKRLGIDIEVTGKTAWNSLPYLLK